MHKKFFIIALFIGLVSGPVVPAFAQDGFSVKRIGDDMELYGEWVQGGVIRGKLLNRGIANLKINKQVIHLLDLDNEKRFVFGFGRDDKLKQVLSYQKGDERVARQYVIRKRDYKIQRINGLPNSKVSVDEKHLNRIYKEYALAKKARARLSKHKGFSESFIPPLLGIITGVYGSQRILNGKPRRPHFGIDIAAPTGTPVVAPANGIVSLTHDDMFFSGGTLIVDHGLGLSSTFIHLDKILVKEGEVVKQGQVIAEVGATGRVTGAHLDWRMNWFKKRVDPSMILSPSLREDFLTAKRVKTMEKK